jgi:predicted transcriptional regulator
MRNSWRTYHGPRIGPGRDLSRATDRPRSWLLERALKDYLETHAWQVAHTRRGLEDLESGRGVAHEKVEAWLLTWGSVNETEPPE